jgi:TRAP-type C4-dicarboxylate transport system permease small subunit
MVLVASHTTSAFLKAIRAVENALAYIGGVSLMLMVILGASDVIGRYVFRHPILGALESSQIMMAVMIFLGWGFTQAQKRHITVDVIMDLYPARARAILDLLMSFLSLGLFGILLWKSALIGISDWQLGRLVEILKVPVAPFKLLIPLGAFFVCIECIIHMIQLLAEIRKAKES